MGAWAYIEPRLHALLGRDIPLSYIGRPERASPAVGSARIHAAEQAEIVAHAFYDVATMPHRVRGVKNVG
jgi:2-oxoglutarate dehydrogenase E1 component